MTLCISSFFYILHLMMIVFSMCSSTRAKIYEADPNANIHQDFRNFYTRPKAPESWTAVQKLFKQDKKELCKDVYKSLPECIEENLPFTKFKVYDEHTDDEFIYPLSEEKSCKANVLFCLVYDSIIKRNLSYYLAEGENECIFVIFVIDQPKVLPKSEHTTEKPSINTNKTTTEKSDSSMDSDYEEEDASLRYKLCPIHLAEFDSGDKSKTE